MKNKTQKTTFVKGLKSKLQSYSRGEKLRTVQEDGDNEGTCQQHGQVQHPPRDRVAAPQPRSQSAPAKEGVGLSAELSRFEFDWVNCAKLK